jgi:hypothetical protein
VSDALRIGPLLSLLVRAELQRGDVDAAEVVANRLDQVVAEVEVVPLRADTHVARGRVLAARADNAGSIGQFEQAVTTLGNDERPLQLAEIRLELAEALAPATPPKPWSKAEQHSPVSSVLAPAYAATGPPHCCADWGRPGVRDHSAPTTWPAH